MASNFYLNPRTQTMESGRYYAGKEKADKRYASGLTQSTSPYTAQGIANRNAQAAGGGSGMPGGAYKLSSVGGGMKSDTANRFQQAAVDAAVAQAEAEIEDDLAAANALQSERTAQFARDQANSIRPPGGGVKRGTTTIGEASGSGLLKMNANARRQKKVEAATKGAQWSVLQDAINRKSSLRTA